MDLPKAPLNRRTLAHAAGLFRYLWPYRGRFALAMAFLFVGGVAGLGFPYFAGSLVDAALLRLRDEAPTSWLHNVNLIALVLVGVLAVQAAFAFLRTVLFVDIGERTLVDLRRDTFARLVRLPMTFHHSRRVGELSSRVASDLTRLRDTLVSTVPHFLREMVLLAGGVALILATSLRLTVVMLLSVPVLMVVAVGFGQLIRRVAKLAQDRLADSSVVVEESLQNIAAVKAFTGERYEQDRYGKALGDYLAVALRSGVYEGAFVSFIVFALFGSIVLVLWYGAHLVLDGQLSPGDLARFMLLTVYVAGAVGSFAETYSGIQRTLGASERVREILDETPEALPEAPPPPRRLRGEVAFDDVHFRYPSRPEVPVLRGLSLEARPGERIALVGPSGAGKSTTMSLLLRFFDPDSGVVRVDGRDVRDYDLHELRGNLALVPQDVVLFGGTIADNIAYGRPGATRVEVEHAARLANAHDFIAAFPDGYETKVGERGVRACPADSAQRVAIARAVLRDPAVLLLDEATSSLDAGSERLVLEAARPADGGPYRDRHRSPPVDRAAGRPHLRGRRRPRWSSPAATRH
ncbi:MAG: ABC transporter transmembrane domain-containing protein [Gemmataceae bacterium]